MRGLKRKWSDKEHETADNRIAGKLHHGLREVKKAVKAAKTYETQKLVKRLKEARSSTKPNSSNTVGELEAELDYMKRISPDQVAATALKTKLNKNHSLRNNDQMQSAITSQLTPNCVVPAEPGSPLAKVQARLLSSKVVANAAVAVVHSILRFLHPESAVSNAADGVEDDAQTSDRPHKLSRLRTESPGGSDLEDDDDGDAASVESDEEDAYQGSDDAPEEEVGSGGASDDSGVIHSDAYDEDDPDSDDPHANSRSTKSEGAGNSKSDSTFLPSLSVGFIRGDSDSDFSDGEAASILGGPKKNRRGQRARRAIWEKKFGKNANHIKKGRDQGSSQGGARDRRGGGQESFARYNKRGEGTAESASKHPPRRANPGAVPAQSNARMDTHPRVPNARPKEEKPLHPSWEAKKKLKEKQAASIVPPQGKKIKF
ncbi:Bud-site selection protein [Heliocybe sulcata]|uniref:Bud-site selection protein n=1 Tax=Heliocybe sulcata TaxID=5364 RepID=A0A5C3N7S3_9AGAM|nr:Bud-site selection protein [Heliocybe sulcata]